MMVEVDKLGRRTSNMVAVFSRLLTQTRGTPDEDTVKTIGNDLITQLQALLSTS